MEGQAQNSRNIRTTLKPVSVHCTSIAYHNCLYAYFIPSHQGYVGLLLGISFFEITRAARKLVEQRITSYQKRMKVADPMVAKKMRF